jgi:hypothetical protein
MGVEPFFKQYCETYIGDSSKLPIVRLRPREYRKTCPLNNKGLCIVHKVKPAVCALFPLGRMSTPGVKGFKYYSQDPSCGSKRESHTVSEWLAFFNMEEEEPLSMLWHEHFAETGAKTAEVMECGDLSEEGQNYFYTLLFFKMYIDYDTDRDYLTQFNENFATIAWLLRQHDLIKNGHIPEELPEQSGRAGS